MTRGALRTAPPFARFRCAVCQSFVHGTQSGHCPRCGWVPPSLLELPRAVPMRQEVRLVALVLVLLAVGVVVYFSRHFGA